MKKIVFIAILFIFSLQIYSQSNFRVMFYNVENLFDYEHDEGKDDKEFLPDGQRHWTKGRYQNKLNNIAKVITSIGEWSSPAIVGLCEVENEKVMTGLTKYSPLKSQKYRYVMTESDDARGVDVALMYQPDQFRYIGHHAYRVSFKTRDILHVTGKILSGDTLDIFVCHFPSRRNGEKESESRRIEVAQLVKVKSDSIMRTRKKANIIIMGDFNDEPSNKSMSVVLNARSFSQPVQPRQLYNLMFSFEKIENKGSYKYRDTWNMLDQIIISGNIFNQKTFKVLPETTEIFYRNFLLTEDKTNGGKRPKKTFSGMKHEGGFSDHLPVFVDFFISSPQ